MCSGSGQRQLRHRHTQPTAHRGSNILTDRRKTHQTISHSLLHWLQPLQPLQQLQPLYPLHPSAPKRLSTCLL